MTQYEYQVLELKDSLFRGKQSSTELQSILNGQARQGWQFKHMMSEDIKGRLGMGSTSGVLMVFERPIEGHDPVAYQSQVLHTINENLVALVNAAKVP